MNRIGISLLAISALVQAGVAQRGERQHGLDNLPSEARFFPRLIRSEMSARYSATRKTFSIQDGKRHNRVEQVLRDGTRSRVEFPDRDDPRHGEVVVENGRMRKHWVPRKNTIFEGPARRQERLTGQFPRVLEGIRKGDLRVKAAGTSRIAGRECRNYEIRRKDDMLVWTLGVDSEKFLLLKQEIYDPTNDKRVIGGFEIATIDFDVKVDDQDFEIVKNGAKIVHDEYQPVEEVQRELDFRILKPRMPAGYTLVGAKIFQVGPNRGAHLVFEDSTAMVPVSIFEVRGNLPREQIAKHKAADFQMVSRQVDDIFAVVMGRLPVDQIRSIADSLK